MHVFDGDTARGAGITDASDTTDASDHRSEAAE